MAMNRNFTTSYIQTCKRLYKKLKNITVLSKCNQNT